jgi:hypothetical protein
MEPNSTDIQIDDVARIVEGDPHLKGEIGRVAELRDCAGRPYAFMINTGQTRMQEGSTMFVPISTIKRQEFLTAVHRAMDSTPRAA